MDSLHRRSFSSTISHFSFPRSYPTPGRKLSSMSSPVSPVSPTYTSFSSASPVSSSSSASFPHEESPVPEHPFDTLASGMDGVYTPSSSVPFYTAQGDIPASYAADFEYNVMNWSPQAKKQVSNPLPLHHPQNHYNHFYRHQQHHIPSHSISNDADRFKSLNPIYIPPPVPPQRSQQQTSPSTIHSPVPSHPIRTFQHQQQQKPRPEPAADSLFDVELEDWHASNDAGLQAQAQFSSNHTQSHSAALAQVYQYPPAPTSAPPVPRHRQEDLTVFTGMGSYSSPASLGQSQPPSAIAGQQPHIFDLSAPVVSLPNATAATLNPNQSALMSPLQLSRTQNGSLSYYSSSGIPQQQPYDRSLQQLQHAYATVHPAEISPVDSCGSASPHTPYADVSDGIVSNVNCNPRFVSEQNNELKAALGADMGMHMQNWAGERRGSLASVASSFTNDEGEADAEGEVDEGDNGWALGLDTSNGGMHITPGGQLVGHNHCDEGGSEMPLLDGSESDLHSGDSEEDAEDDGSGEFVMRSRRSAPNVSSSFPSVFAFGGEGRNLRPRSSPRYSPYATYPLSTNGFQDQQYASSSHPSHSASRSRRYASVSSSSSPRTIGGNSGSSTSTSSTRRRSRPMTSLPMPVPIPNLTKKSRGRHVPTASSMEDLRNAASGAGRKKRKEGETARPHECQVDGCGKVFARGEHLKRHVRSLHTNEKPFKCKYPGCGKRFSRHDNLGQHQRVHKDYIPPDDAEMPDSDSD